MRAYMSLISNVLVNAEVRFNFLNFLHCLSMFLKLSSCTSQVGE